MANKYTLRLFSKDKDNNSIVTTYYIDENTDSYSPIDYTKFNAFNDNIKNLIYQDALKYFEAKYNIESEAGRIDHSTIAQLFETCLIEVLIFRIESNLILIDDKSNPLECKGPYNDDTTV